MEAACMEEGGRMGSTEGEACAASPYGPLSPSLTFERPALDSKSYLSLLVQVAKPFSVLGITKLE